MKRLIKVTMLSLTTIFLISWVQPPVTLFLVGDSTMADKPLEGNPERGWGMVLPSYFNNQVVIENHARNGRSSRTFMEEGRWDFVLDRVKSGDFVVIQFGHNDEGQEKKAYTPPDAYQKNLIKMVNDVRAKNATPILCTPVARCKFDSLTHQLIDTHPIYGDLVRKVAADQHVLLVDMQRRSEDILRAFGPGKAEKLFMNIPPGVWPAVPQGRKDNTHFVEAGGLAMAKCFVDGIKELNLQPLKSDLLSENKVTVKLTTPVSGLDKIKPR